MRVRKKLSKSQKLIRKILLSIIALIVAVVTFFELTVEDRLELVIIAEIKTLSHTAINNAVNNYIKDNKYICDNLVEVTVDGSSNISAISENTYNINLLKTELNDMAQKEIDTMMRVDGLDVKLGNFTGLVILSDFGPYVHINIESTPTVSCEIVSTFESAGINQTLHHIVLEVYVDIYVGNPFRIESIQFSTDYEIAQTIIVGNIPSTYGSISRY